MHAVLTYAVSGPAEDQNRRDPSLLVFKQGSCDNATGIILQLKHSQCNQFLSKFQTKKLLFLFDSFYLFIRCGCDVLWSKTSIPAVLKAGRAPARNHKSTQSHDSHRSRDPGCERLAQGCRSSGLSTTN